MCQAMLSCPPQVVEVLTIQGADGGAPDKGSHEDQPIPSAGAIYNVKGMAVCNDKGKLDQEDQQGQQHEAPWVLRFLVNVNHMAKSLLWGDQTAAFICVTVFVVAKTVVVEHHRLAHSSH
eukprot:GDKJ01058984.1.p2 GENE.GDKJ01058984.1~~GDKJ01058984.1.p2  ORF type:complete len:120 (+),score=0.18 GDKJ01058984.1:793-1152(+)